MSRYDQRPPKEIKERHQQWHDQQRLATAPRSGNRASRRLILSASAGVLVVIAVVAVLLAYV